MAAWPSNGSSSSGSELLSRRGNPREKPSLVNADVYSENNGEESFELSETSANSNGSNSRISEADGSPFEEGSRGFLNDLNAESPSGAHIVGMNVIEEEKFCGGLGDGESLACEDDNEMSFSMQDLSRQDEKHEPRQILKCYLSKESATPNGHDSGASPDFTSTDLNSNVHVNGMNVDESRHALTSGRPDLEGQVPPAKLDFRENYFQPDKYSSQSSSLSSVTMEAGDHDNGCYCNTSGNESSSALHYSDQSSVSSEIICHSPMCSCRLCYENDLRENQGSNFRSHSDSSSDEQGSLNYKSEQCNPDEDDLHMAESSFIEFSPPKTDVSPPTQPPLAKPDPHTGIPDPAINRCYIPPDIPTQLQKQEVQAEVHLSVMSLPGADAGTPTEQLPTGSLRLVCILIVKINIIIVGISVHVLSILMVVII